SRRAGSPARCRPTAPAAGPRRVAARASSHASGRQHAAGQQADPAHRGRGIDPQRHVQLRPAVTAMRLQPDAHQLRQPAAVGPVRAPWQLTVLRIAAAIAEAAILDVVEQHLRFAQRLRRLAVRWQQGQLQFQPLAALAVIGRPLSLCAIGCASACASSPRRKRWAEPIWSTRAIAALPERTPWIALRTPPYTPTSSSASRASAPSTSSRVKPAARFARPWWWFAALPFTAGEMPPSPPTACPLVERVGVRGASTLPQVSRRFRAAAAARVTSPLLVHARAGARANGEAGPKGGGHGCPESRRSHQEKTTPRWRALRPSMGYGCAGGLRGFPTAPPCAGGKLARIPAGHPADFPPPTRRAIGGPGEAARSCAQKQRQEHPTPALPCR